MDETENGWKIFAGLMILIGGSFNFIDGLVGLTQTREVEARTNGLLPLTNDIKTWSWVVLIIGAVMILAAFLIFAGHMFGRIVGVIAATVNAVIQLSYLQHNTFWSFTMILVDFLVIWALVVHGGRLVTNDA
jgi:hypothetical protein